MKKTEFYTKPFSAQLTLVALFISVFAFSVQAQQYTNLIKNSGTNVDLTDWDIVDDQGSGYVLLPTDGYDGTGAVQSGYQTRIEQTVDLVAVGYPISLLDEAPIIRYADWVKGGGTDPADYYLYSIELLDENDNIITSFTSSNAITTSNWEQNTTNFINYGPGLRKIKVIRRGQDAEYDETSTQGTIMDAAYLSINNHFTNASTGTGDLSGWDVVNAGDGWSPNNPTVYPGFITSYETCSKSQTVNLMDLGYTAAELDSEPRLEIWEFFLGYDGPQNGTGIGDSYYRNIELRDGSGNIIASAASGNLTCTDQWQEQNDVFENYGPGLREVYLEHGGIDIEYWQGHYGSIIDATQMTLEFTPIVSSVKETADNNLDLTVYPNPVSPNTPIAISIDNDIQGTYLLEMTDVMGRVIHQSEIEKTNTSHQSSFVPDNIVAGMYMLTVRKDNFVATQRVIVR